MVSKCILIPNPNCYFNFWHQFSNSNSFAIFLLSHANRNEYTALGIKYKPLSLAHGFPDFLGPKYITDALINAASNPDYLLNQYTRGFVRIYLFWSLHHAITNWWIHFFLNQKYKFFKGHPRLVHALSALYSKLINRKIDPFNEILVTSGITVNNNTSNKFDHFQLNI